MNTVLSRFSTRRRGLIGSTFLSVLLAFFLFVCYERATSSELHNYNRAERTNIEELTKRAAGNRTLGFNSIKFINLPNRFDRSDALRIQAYLSDIDVEEYPAIPPDQLNAVGLPPSSNSDPKALKPGEKGCWRAHANIWSEIMEKRLPPVLILESDATWDVDVRNIMALLNEQFTELLSRLHSKPLYSNQTGMKDSEGQSQPQSPKNKRSASFIPNPDDPWRSDHWDLFSLGHCYDNQKSPSTHIKYMDPYVPEGKLYFGEKLGHERVVHQSGGFACTTAYAITQRGAAKLLLRTAFNFDLPVDLIIKSMIANGELVAYTTIPTVMAQWHYVKGLGMEHRGANSDIQGIKGEHHESKGGILSLINGDEVDLSGWDNARRAKSVWTVRPSHPDIAFNRMALGVAWDMIFSSKKIVEAA